MVLERNAQPLKKLLMTGNGKCNYMNEVNNMDSY
ncbi:MAG: NAD(P)/FAD-dependent oxidoreductase, partial [Oscillospiraceae bacterium]|nr:NAD(P)/FAD-dependent oxidoreductase [Oscillospiraceae bacterium]